MISAESLDAYLELWARYVVADRRSMRALWYPRETPEHRYARSGGVMSVTPQRTIVPADDAQILAEQIDGAMARLLAHNDRWFHAVRDYYVDGTVRVKREHLYAGKRWLRSALC